MIHRLKKSSFLSALVIAVAALTAWIADLAVAAPHHRCVCGPDGSCPPNAFHFGFYQTQWRTWPKPPGPEDLRKPEAVTLPKVQLPGVTEEDVDVPTRPKAAPKTDGLPLPGDDTTRPTPKPETPDSKTPESKTHVTPDKGILDILEPRPKVKAPVKTEATPKTEKLPKTETLPKTSPPAKPNPFGDEKTQKEKAFPDVLNDLEGTKKSPSKAESSPAPPKKLPDLDLPLDEGKKLDEPPKELPKAEATKTSALDLSKLDLSPRSGVRPASVSLAMAPGRSSAGSQPAGGTLRPGPVPESIKSAAPARETSANSPASDNPLRSGWTPRRSPSPLRAAGEASGDSRTDPSWNSRKNPLRDR